MGYEARVGEPLLFIDRNHRLMHLGKGGDVYKVNEYLDEHGLRPDELFRRVFRCLSWPSPAATSARPWKA